MQISLQTMFSNGTDYSPSETNSNSSITSQVEPSGSYFEVPKNISYSGQITAISK